MQPLGGGGGGTAQKNSHIANSGMAAGTTLCTITAHGAELPCYTSAKSKHFFLTAIILLMRDDRCPTFLI